MITLQGVSCVRDGQVQLPELSIQFKLGKLYVIMGPSGGGKSTLLRIVAGLQEPTSGKVLRDDGVQCNMIFQTVNLWPHLRLQRQMDIVHQGISMQDRESYAERLGLVGLMQRYPNELSQGQRQRAALLRCLITAPDVLLADEVTSAQDRDMASVVVTCLSELVGSGRQCVVLVSHDADLMKVHADSIMWLEANGLSDAAHIGGRQDSHP